MEQDKKEKLFSDLNKMAEDIEESTKNPLAQRVDVRTPTTWSFTVKYKLTKPNVDIHKEFVEFSKDFSDDNYLQGIKLLINNWKQSAQVAMCFDEIMRNREMISEIQNQIDELKQPKEEEKKPKRKTFGGNEQ